MSDPPSGEPKDPGQPAQGPAQRPAQRPGLQPVSAAALTGFLVVGLIGGWSLHRIGDLVMGHAPVVTWSQVIAPYAAAVVLAILAWVTWGQVQRREGGSRWAPGARQRSTPLDFQRAINRLVLARASALVGCLIAGGYLGFALSWLFVPGEYAISPALRSTITGVGGVLMTLMALALQRACRVRSDDAAT